MIDIPIKHVALGDLIVRWTYEHPRRRSIRLKHGDVVAHDWPGVAFGTVLKDEAPLALYYFLAARPLTSPMSLVRNTLWVGRRGGPVCLGPYAAGMIRRNAMSAVDAFWFTGFGSNSVIESIYYYTPLKLNPQYYGRHHHSIEWHSQEYASAHNFSLYR
jgi:hypothetical protein